MDNPQLAPPAPTFRNSWKDDFLASVVVFLVALPLCMGIALATGVPPEKAAAVLESLVPSPVPQSKLYRLEEVSKVMENLGLVEAAERLLNDYVSQDPRGGTIAMAAI